MTMTWERKQDHGGLELFIGTFCPAIIYWLCRLDVADTFGVKPRSPGEIAGGILDALPD